MQRERSRRPWIEGWAWVAVLSIAAVLRAVATADQPWEDEIWSLAWARQATSPLRIVTDPNLHVDNNHWLNTLVLYVIGERTQWFWYRLPALCCGIGLVAMCLPLARRWGRGTGLLAATLIGCSFVFVVYASEARGYGPVVFFGVVALWALRRFVERGRRPSSAVLFWVACVLGFLAHASFVYAFAGALTYAPAALSRRRTAVKLLRDLALLFAVPASFFAWLYVTAIVPMRIAGSGQATTVGGMLTELMSVDFGLPDAWADGTWVGLAVVAAGVAYGVLVLARRRRDEWVFLLTAGVVAPALLIAIRQPQPLYARYLFAGMPFVMLLLAVAARDLFCRGPAARVFSGLCVTALLVGSATQLAPFLRLGRGQNRQAIAYLVAHTPGRTISYDSVYREGADLLLDYYVPRVAMDGKTLRYLPPDSPDRPDWYLVQRYFPGPIPFNLTVGPRADAFDLAAVFPHAGVSGCDWFIFHRVAPATVSTNATRPSS